MNADVMIKKRIVAIAAASLLTMVSAADEIAGKCRHASVEAARDAARTMPKPAVVRLASGVHRLEKPLVLTPEDSGVTYVADGDVVISGSRPVTSWRVEPDGTWRSLDAWRKMGKDINSVYADPLFKDAAGRDFRLKPESPAFKTGFVDFNQSDIGQRKNGNSQ